jgi:hypothetical protein
MCTAKGAIWVVAALTTLSGQYAYCQPDSVPPSTSLTKIRSICVDKLSGEANIAGVARELAISGIFSAKRFTVTEKCDNADAVLRGAVLERAEVRARGEGEGTSFGQAAGGAQVNNRSGSAAFGAIAGAGSESLYSAETRSTASVVLRLVDHDGTVVWAHSQDSAGGKVRGAIADAIDRSVKQLLRDLNRTGPAPPN